MTRLTDPVLVLHDAATLKHKTVELLGARLIQSLETPDRVEAIIRAAATCHELQVQEILVDQASAETVSRYLSKTHDQGYVNHLSNSHGDWLAAGHILEHESILPECFPTFAMPQNTSQSGQIMSKLSEPKDIFARSGFYSFDMSAGIMKHTMQAALASANLAIQAARKLKEDPGMQVIVALCRPPGHHCDTTKAGGYCYLNNSVLAVTELMPVSYTFGSRNPDLDIAILDIDFHHGNGTQSAFYDRQVRYVSIHGQDEYPYYSGTAGESGCGLGAGFNHNFPLAQKTSEEQYLLTLDEAVTTCLSSRPKYLVLSLGFDTFHLDPLGGFSLDATSYTKIANLIAHRLRLGGVQAIILLEGGYVVERLGENFLAFMRGWLDPQVPQS